MLKTDTLKHFVETYRRKNQKCIRRRSIDIENGKSAIDFVSWGKIKSK